MRVLLAALGGLVLLFLLHGAHAQATVTVADDAFKPSSVQVTEGESVTWRFGSRDTHTVSPDQGRGAWCPAANAGDCTVPFPSAGTFTYHCAFHPTMTGVVEVVKAPAPPPATPAPNEPPVAAFNLSVDGLRVLADGSSSTDPEGALAAFAWVWGDFEPASSGMHAEHAYARPGTYEVRLTVMDAGGAHAQTVRMVTVSLPDEPPRAAFTLALDGWNVTVDASSSADPEGGNLTLAWDWGDGTPEGEGAQASHAYAGPGPWNLTLRVRDAAGHVATASRTLAFESPVPEVMEHEPAPTPAPTALVEPGPLRDASPTAPPLRVDFSSFEGPRVPGPGALLVALCAAGAALAWRRR